MIRPEPRNPRRGFTTEAQRAQSSEWIWASGQLDGERRVTLPAVNGEP
jgi:hypothetical protein